MTKSQVKAQIVEYIKAHNLKSQLINTHNKPMLEKEMDTFYFWYDVQAPHGVECSVFLFEECIEVRGYYSECIAKELQEHPLLLLTGSHNLQNYAIICLVDNRTKIKP